MPTGVVTVSTYTPQPAIQVDPASTFEVRGWYTRSIIAGDGVTPILGNDSSGNEGPYIDVPSTLNASGYLVVPSHDIQATTLSNPTANYFEGLWIDGAFTQMLMPNNNVSSGWAIPTIYGSIIAIDEIALYNRAKRLLFPPDTYPTFDEVVLLIQRLAGNFAYAAVNVNGITSMSVAPVLASLPIAVGDNDPRIGSYVNIISQGAATTNSPAQNTVFVQAAVTAAAALGLGIYWPVGYFPINSITISVPCLFAPGNSGPQPGSGQTVTFTKAIEADASKHFDYSASGLVSFLGNRTLRVLYPEWWGAKADGTTACETPVQAAITAAKTCTVTQTPFGTITAGVAIEFGTGNYLFNSGVTWTAAQNTSIVMRGQGYATMFTAGADNMTILTLDQGTSSSQGLNVSGIYFFLNLKDAAAINLTFGGQLARFQDIWVTSPSATGTKNLITLAGEFIVLDNVQVEGTGSSRALTNTNTGIFLSTATHGLYRIWMKHVQFLLLDKGLEVDASTIFVNGASLVFKESSASSCNTAIDIGGVGITGTAQSNWTIEDCQFEGNFVHINLLGFSGGGGGAPLREVTIEKNYFTGMVTGDVGIAAKNVTGFYLLRNYWKNADNSDHGAVAVSVMSGVSLARKEGNFTTSGTSVNMTIAGNATGSATSTPVFTNADLSSDGVSIDQLTDPLVGIIQSLSGAGAVNLTTLTTAFTSTGGGQALTLANGAAGQIKTITHVVDGGSGILTPTTKTGFSTITFTNAGDSVILQYFTTAGWMVMGSYGVVIAP